MQVVLEGVDNLSGVVNAISAVFSGNFTAALDLALKGLEGVSSAFTGFLQSAIQGEDATTAFDFALQKQGASAVITAQHGQALAESLKNLVGGQNDTVLSAESVLLKFHEINSEAFPGALRLSADLAASMGTDMSSAAQALGKALENPTTGMRLIKTVGGEVDPVFQKIIKSMVEQGDVADADAAIMAKLNDVIGGKAANAASTLSGEWKTLWGNLSDVGQKIGDDFLPLLHTLFDTVVKPGAAYVEALGSKFADLMSVFKGGDLTAGLTNLLADLQIAYPALGNVQQNVMNLAASLRTGLTDAFHFVVAAGISVVQFFQTNWPLIQSTAKTVWDDLSRIFNDVGGEIKNVLLPAIQAISGESTTHLPKAQSVFETVMAVINQAMSGVVNVVEKYVLPAFTAFVNWVEANWPMISKIANTVFSAFGVYLKAWQAEAEIGFNGVTTLVAIFMDVFTGKWSNIGTRLQTLWTANWDIIKGLLNDALNVLSSAIGNFDWAAVGGKIFDGIKAGIFGGHASGPNGPYWFNTGQDVASSLANGMNSNAHVVTSAASDMGRAAAQAYNNSLYERMASGNGLGGSVYSSGGHLVALANSY